MAELTITERPREPDGAAAAAISINHGDFFHAALTGLSPDGAGTVFDWYLGEYPRLPFHRHVQARDAAERITRYGQDLFSHLLTPEAQPDYRLARRGDLLPLRTEVNGMYLFHYDHWEALKDPDLPHPFAYYGPVIRRVRDPYFAPAELRVQPSPLVNVLVVSARPEGMDGRRNPPWARPVFESLQQAGLQVHVDLLRPPTFAQLRALLAERAVDGAGFYHLIIFDAPVQMMPYADLQAGIAAGRFIDPVSAGRLPVHPYDRADAYLFLEGGGDALDAVRGALDAVRASQLGRFLVEQQVPAVLLNACNAAPRTRTSLSTLAIRLMLFGLPAALCAVYPLSETAVRQVLPALTRALADGQPLADAVHSARQQLFSSEERAGWYDQTLPLRDWMALAYYQNQPVTVQRRPFGVDEARAYYARWVNRFPYPPTEQRFAGRESEILQIERRILGGDGGLLLVHGRGGVGKSALLETTAAWWQATRLVEEVFHFDFARRPWPAQEIADTAARRLLPPEQFQDAYEPASPAERLRLLAGALNGPRHLFLLDNFRPADPQAFPPAARAEMFALLAMLRRTRALALIGARSPEDWLRPPAPGGGPTNGGPTNGGPNNDNGGLPQQTPGRPHPLADANTYLLSGLDPRGQAALLARLVGAEQVPAVMESAALPGLLDLLGGHPLALQVTCPRLRSSGALALLQQLEAGPPDPAQPAGQPHPRATSETILDALDVARSRLTPAERRLLLILAPFNSVLDESVLVDYLLLLREKPALAALGLQGWDALLAQLRAERVIYPCPEAQGCLVLQPIVSFYLQHLYPRELAADERACLEQAFRDAYTRAAEDWLERLRAHNPAVRQAAQAQVRREWPNLERALDLCLDARIDFGLIYRAMQRCARDTGDFAAAERLFQRVVARQADYREVLNDAPGVSFIAARSDMGGLYLERKNFAAARQQFQQARSLLNRVAVLPEHERELRSGELEGQLGQTYQAEQDWKNAERHYRTALRHFCLKHFPLERANAQKVFASMFAAQGQWAKAETLQQRALQIYLAVERNPEDFPGANGDQGPNKADLYQRLGETYHALNDAERARGCWLQSAEITDAFAAQYDLQSQQNPQGSAEAWEIARGFYTDSLRVYERLNEHYHCARIHMALARAAVRQHCWDEAVDHFQQASELYVRHQDRGGQARALRELGLVKEEQGQPESAKRHYRAALEISQSVDSRELSLSVIQSLAAYARRFNDATIPDLVAQVLGITPAEAEELLNQ